MCPSGPAWDAVKSCPSVRWCGLSARLTGCGWTRVGKVAGRGAYLHDRHECWVRGMRGALAHALKTELTAEDRARLEEFMKTLPAETNG